MDRLEFEVNTRGKSKTMSIFQIKEGAVELPFNGRVVTGDSAKGLNESFLLPLGSSNGIDFWLDGSRVANFQRSDMCIAWLVKQKAEKEAAAEGDTTDKPAEETPVKKRRKVQKQVQPTIYTHTVQMRPKEFSRGIRGKPYKFQLNVPYLVPIEGVVDADRVGVELLRKPYVLTEHEKQTLKRVPKEKVRKLFAVL